MYARATVRVLSTDDACIHVDALCIVQWDIGYRISDTVVPLWDIAIALTGLFFGITFLA